MLVDRRLLLGVFVSAMILCSTHLPHLEVAVGEKITFSEISAGSCMRVITEEANFNCPKETFLIRDSEALNETYDLLYSEIGKGLPEIDFQQSSIVFVYINLLNSGWMYQILGITEQHESITIHTIKQRIREGVYQQVIELYHILEIDATNKTLNNRQAVQYQGVTWLGIASEFMTGFLVAITAFLQIRSLYHHWRGSSQKLGEN